MGMSLNSGGHLTHGYKHNISSKMMRSVFYDVDPKTEILDYDQIAKIAKLEITGVDILCKDITSKDISAKNVCVLETNDSPGVDIHHFPFVGKGEDISTMILDYIFR